MTRSRSAALTAETDLDFDAAVARVRDELPTEGFGVLTEIDVKATLKEKLGEDVEPYLILGACNPALAHQALGIEPEIGVLLPCNVVVYRRDGRTVISAVDAERMLSIVGNDELAGVAAEVRDRLGRVVERASCRTRWRAGLAPTHEPHPNLSRCWTCACRVGAAHRTAPLAWTSPATSPRYCTRSIAANCGHAATTRWAACPRGTDWQASAPRLPTRCSPARSAVS